MRRLASISALVLIFLSASLWAQRRGGSVGFHGGFTPRGGVTFHAPVPRSGITIRTFPGPFTHFHHRFAYRPYWGYGYRPYYAYGYPGYYGYYGYAGSYDQGLWGSSSAYSYDTSSNDSASAYNAYYEQTQQLQQQLNRLQDEVDRLHDQQYARPVSPDVPRPPSSPATPDKQETATFTVLIFKDQHREEVKNYAVVGRTLWIFSEQRARKIPLDQLNVPATQQANEERGLDFRIPG
jgi:hypothetical protein